MDPSHCIAGLYFPWLAAFRPPKPSLGLCLDVRGYCSRRFHVQSFGHVSQVLIKLYDKLGRWPPTPPPNFTAQAWRARAVRSRPAGPTRDEQHHVEEAGPREV